MNDEIEFAIERKAEYERILRKSDERKPTFLISCLTEYKYLRDRAGKEMEEM